MLKQLSYRKKLAGGLLASAVAVACLAIGADRATAFRGGGFHGGTFGGGGSFDRGDDAGFGGGGGWGSVHNASSFSDHADSRAVQRSQLTIHLDSTSSPARAAAYLSWLNVPV